MQLSIQDLQPNAGLFVPSEDTVTKAILLAKIFWEFG